jgi:hypothetical protein
MPMERDRKTELDGPLSGRSAHGFFRNLKKFVPWMIIEIMQSTAMPRSTTRAKIFSALEDPGGVKLPWRTRGDVKLPWL